MLIWITGLSGSGKTTIGKKLYEYLKIKYDNVLFLDGDIFREVLGSDLGHNIEDRLKNAKRIARMCKFLVSQDMIVICATMSLYKEIHRYNRKEILNYYEVFIECSIDELKRRDQKELYSQSLKGLRDDIVGINLPYDKPVNCELVIDNNEQKDLDLKVNKILDLIGENVLNETR